MKAPTIFINILSLASLYLAVSCNEEEQHDQTVSTILATIEQSSTRTALDGPDADGVYKTIWSSDDAIAVFSGSNAASEFKLTSGANTNTAEFEGNAASDNIFHRERKNRINNFRHTPRGSGICQREYSARRLSYGGSQRWSCPSVLQSQLRP